MAKTDLNTMVRRAKRDPLSPLIDRYLLERTTVPLPHVTPPRPRLPGQLSPSDMRCLRRSAFKFMDAPQKRKRTPEQKIVFAVGDWYHWGWYGIFLHMEQVLGPDVFRVVGIERRARIKRFRMSGHLDVHVEIHGVPYIIDVKSCNDREFTERMHVRSPKDQHRKQLIRYLRAKKIKHGIIMYHNKNDQRWKVFEVPFDAELWLQTEKWLVKINRQLDAGKVPPRHDDCMPGTFMAKDCPYSHLCYKGSKPVGKSRVRALLYEGKPSAQEMWEANNG